MVTKYASSQTPIDDKLRAEGPTYTHSTQLAPIDAKSRAEAPWSRKVDLSLDLRFDL
jgi:hypothetical protein